MFLFPLFYVIREFHRFLHRGKAQPSYLMTEMFIQPKTHWNIKKNYHSYGNKFKRKICKGILEIFLFMQITNFLADLCSILAVLNINM